MKTFRLVSFIEGCSLLLLLFVAMPLKYYAGMPAVVWYVGMGHGILFMLFAALSLTVSHRQGWSVGYWLLVLLLGVVPFGFLLLDTRLRAETRSVAAESAA